jgi:DeoR family fructose operon transcriptional repressor
MIQASRKTAILTISEKLNTVLKMKIADLSEVDYIITELNPDDQQLQSYRKSDLVLI